MWLNFPRLGFTSTTVCTKEFIHLNILFHFFFIYKKRSLCQPGGAAFDVLNALFLHMFVHEILLYETESIFHTQSVLSLNGTLPGVLFLWELMFNCIMHTQVLSFSVPIKSCWQAKEGPQAVLCISLRLSPLFCLFLFVPKCNREEWGMEIF